MALEALAGKSYGFPIRYYSEYVTKTFNPKTIKMLEEQIGRTDLGFLIICIANHDKLVESHGFNSIVSLLDIIRRETFNILSSHYTDCGVISAETFEFSDMLVCLKVPGPMAINMEPFIDDFHSKLFSACRTLTASLVGAPVEINLGYSRIGRRYEGNFYRAVFNALYRAKKTAYEERNTVKLRLRNYYNEILEKSLLNCLFQPVINMRNGDVAGWDTIIQGPADGTFSTSESLFTFAACACSESKFDLQSIQMVLQRSGRIESDQRFFIRIHWESVNDPEFVSQLSQLIVDTDRISPSNIVLSLYEKQLSENFVSLSNEIVQIRRQGFKIALIGCGNSRPGFITDIKPDYFILSSINIRGIRFHPMKEAMLDGLSAITDKTGTRLIADGVETGAELRTLSMSGVQYGKGPFIAPYDSMKLETVHVSPKDLIFDQSPGQISSLTPISDLAQQAVTVSSDVIVSEVKALLKDKDPLCSVVVIEGQTPAGLLMSYHLDRHLGALYGVSLYYKKSVAVLMDHTPLIVDADLPVGDAAKAAMQRDMEKVYDDVIVVKNGSLQGVVSVQNMLNTLVRIESKARESAESATKAKTRFLANMSHDIRTPMNAILGMTEVLSESRLGAEQQKCVDIIRNAGNNLLELINDILDISKIEAGQIELVKTPFNLVDTIEKECELLALSAHEKDLEFICDIAPDTPVSVVGDSFRLRRVLTNLIGNAIKFTSSGEIEISVTLRNFEKNTAIIEFCITDTGIGIPEDRQTEIFDTFAQACSSTASEFGGTGLGLSICKHFVSLMDGDIWISSRPGKGSTFSFTVRLETEPNLMGDFRELPACNVLIVDDNISMLRFLKKTVQRWGVPVTAAAGGIAGIREMAAARRLNTDFDLVLLDYQMPLKDGLQIIGEMCRQFGFDKERIVMMHRSNDSMATIARGKKQGVIYHVVKPFKFDELHNMMNMALQRERPCEFKIQASEDHAEIQKKPLRILLAEDNENNQTLFTFYLKNTPHIIDIAENGQRCVDKYKNTPYDIVFMDMDMPVMNGYQATQTIRDYEKRVGVQEVPIVALTAHALQGQDQESIDAGCTAHISKPYKKNEILDRLKAILTIQDKNDDLKEGAGYELFIDTPEDEDTQSGEIIGGIDPEFIPLLPGFIRNTQNDIKLLHDAVNSMNYEDMKRLGHRIKGASLCYGFIQLGKLGEEMESAAEKKERRVRIETVLRELNDHMAAILTSAPDETIPTIGYNLAPYRNTP